MIQSIVTSVHCEIANAVKFVIDRDLELSRKYHQKRYAEWLETWAVQVSLTLTVEENLRIGAYTRKDSEGVQRDLRMIYDYFPVLVARRHQVAGYLSGGEQQMLVIGRALMAKPALLLMDEP